MNMPQRAAILILIVASFGVPAGCQAKAPAAKPETVASSVLRTWKLIEYQFISAADAMPEEKYSFAPSSGEYTGVRTFAQQVKHVACANFGFFLQIRGETPPAACGQGGPSPAKTKAELMQYLRESFALANDVIATITADKAMDPVSGPYGGSSTKLGIAVLAVWHASDHYGQMVEYLRMNGVVPPASVGRPPANPQ